MSRAPSARALASLAVLLLSVAPLIVDVAEAVDIPINDFSDFTSPCTLNVSEQGSTRTLTWSAVSGASTYRVGYRLCDGSVVGLAEVTTTSYEHVSAADQCLEYVMVAYDASTNRICAGHNLNWGGDCPCQ